MLTGARAGPGWEAPGVCHVGPPWQDGWTWSRCKAGSTLVIHASATLVGWLELDQAWHRGPRMCCTGAALVGQLVPSLTSKASVLVVGSALVLVPGYCPQRFCFKWFGM